MDMANETANETTNDGDKSCGKSVKSNSKYNSSRKRFITNKYSKGRFNNKLASTEGDVNSGIYKTVNDPFNTRYTKSVNNSRETRDRSDLNSVVQYGGKLNSPRLNTVKDIANCYIDEGVKTELKGEMEKLIKKYQKDEVTQNENFSRNGSNFKTGDKFYIVKNSNNNMNATDYVNGNSRKGSKLKIEHKMNHTASGNITGRSNKSNNSRNNKTPVKKIVKEKNDTGVSEKTEKRDTVEPIDNIFPESKKNSNQNSMRNTKSSLKMNSSGNKFGIGGSKNSPSNKNVSI